jgi:hypothetical protein
MTNYQPPAQPAPFYPQAPRHRPIGVTILAILQVLFGLLMLLTSFVFFGLAAIFAMPDFINQVRDQLPQWLLNMGSGVFLVVGLVILLVAIISFLLARGFLRGQRWSRTVGNILAVLEIISIVFTAAASLNVANIASAGFSAIIPVIILLYLMLPHVKAWFTQ